MYAFSQYINIIGISQKLIRCLPVEFNLLEQQYEDLGSRISHFSLMLDILAATYKLQNVWFRTLCGTRTLF